MIKLPTTSVLILAGMLASCATYESPTAHRTTVTEYGHGSVTYYSTPPVYYVTPAPGPVYVTPPAYVSPPVYVAPAPAFGMQFQASHGFRRHQHRHDGRQRLRGGNAAGAQVGGPGWSGTVWSR